VQVFREKEKANMNFQTDQFRLKVGLAEMLKGGVIMDVVNAEHAVISERAGAAAVMALERVPADIRKEGGVARMSQIRIDSGLCPPQV
jgi:pyridoxal 5'-phosphate synthase pdxS subunit